MNKMKDSNTQWLGVIPYHWNVSKIDNMYTLRKTKVSDKDFPPLSVTMQGILPQLETVAKTDAHDDRKLVKKGDFVINSRSDRRGSCGISDRDGSVSLINTVLKPSTDKMNVDYYNLLFHTIQFADEYYANGHGIVDDLWTTNWQKLKSILIPMPPVEEQEKIAEFLKDKNVDIDALHQDIQSQIETLEEYKKSVITEAVTKGLNPDAEMKDSGIEWIGMIPKDWTIEKGKYMFVQRNQKGNNTELQLLSPTQKYGVIPQEKYEELSGMTAVKLDEKMNLMTLKTIHKGDYCISLRSFQGGFEYSEYEGVVSPAYQVFYPTTEIDDIYFKYMFKEKSFIDKMNSYTMSLRDGKNIAFADFGRTYLPIPTIEMQHEIANNLKQIENEINELILCKQEQIETLTQYKKSIIYEYVTGKKSITGENDEF